MDVTPLIKDGAQVIQSYANGMFRVSGMTYETPILVQSSTTMEWAEIDAQASLVDLSEASFESLIDMADQIDVVLLGTGKTMAFLDPALKKTLSAKGLPIESMDTGAACRTYNVLMAEGRRVVAALLPF